jgi:hypothetical protein
MELRISMLGGGIAWLLHLLLAYLVAEFGCVSGLGSARWWGLSPVTWMLIFVSLLTLGMAIYAFFVSLRAGRKLAEARPAPAAWAPHQFAARYGALSNGMFAFIILAQCLPIFFYLHDC